MSIYLGQLPPAELARLKAELAETLIASFCYPRFYDYRTGTLRMRPVDRSKRQEVWLYLSSIDFSAWNRVDLLSPDFQYQIERLFIQFVQRNRSFFGEQGRKRLSDVRMLISASASSVVEGLRGHLMGQNKNRPPFGSPRPVPSWSTTNVSGQTEPGWERIAQPTFLLQQQVQEWRGEIKGIPQLPTPGQSETARPQPSVAAPVPRRSAKGTGTARGTNGSQPAATAQAMPPQEATHNGNGNATSAPAAKASGPLYPATPAPKASGPLPPPVLSVAPVVPVATGSPGAPNGRGATANGKSDPLAPSQPSAPVMPEAAAPTQPTLPTMPVMSSPTIAPSEVRELQTTSPLRPDFPAPVQEQAKTADPVSPQAVALPSAQAHAISQPVVPAPVSTSPAQRENMASALSGEDEAIFEQLRHQLLLWLRIEALQCGLDISGQSATQLLDLLRQQGSIDETRLQVVSSLLNLANQVLKTGQASLLDYKQAMMFHLMHTRSRRSS